MAARTGTMPPNPRPNKAPAKKRSANEENSEKQIIALKQQPQENIVATRGLRLPSLEILQRVSEGALTRATTEEKRTQLDNLGKWQKENAKDVEGALAKLREVALGGGNVFAELMRTARVASLGQITHTLYEIGGQYRRSM